MVDYTVERNIENWTDDRRYLLKKGKKVVLKFRKEDEANEVCEYLNKLQPSKSRKTSLRPKKSKKETEGSAEKKD